MTKAKSKMVMKRKEIQTNIDFSAKSLAIRKFQEKMTLENFNTYIS
jgi:hypothetical protein